MAVNKDGTTRKKGSGRKKGAVSFVKIPLKELNNLLREDMQVIVSRRFAEDLGLGGTAVEGTPKNILQPKNPIEVEVEQPTPVSVSIQEDW
jgi:hypothetical protein